MIPKSENSIHAIKNCQLSLTTLGINQQHPANNNLHQKQRLSLARKSYFPCREILSTFKVQLQREGK
jgi:hypothetical protein